MNFSIPVAGNYSSFKAFSYDNIPPEVFHLGSLHLKSNIWVIQKIPQKWQNLSQVSERAAPNNFRVNVVRPQSCRLSPKL